MTNEQLWARLASDKRLREALTQECPRCIGGWLGSGEGREVCPWGCGDGRVPVAYSLSLLLAILAREGFKVRYETWNSMHGRSAEVYIDYPPDTWASQSCDPADAASIERATMLAVAQALDIKEATDGA